uniref:Putative heat shock protein n=1 Tax=Haematobia irritans TaxID=7368 RepID=A0A1L8EDG3_HAEIR
MSFRSVFGRLGIVKNFICLKYGTAINTSLNKVPVVTGISESNFVRQYSANTTPIPIVSYDEIKKLPKQPNKLLIDVREPKELQETGQIPTSINIPLGQVATELSPMVDAGTFKAKYGRDRPNKDTEIIFHCKIGKRSNSAAEIARSLGYTNTKNYLGSWTEWAEKEGLPK